MNPENAEVYLRLRGFLKTSFLVELIVSSTLRHSNTERLQLHSKFHNSHQLSRQSGYEWCPYLERQREALRSLGIHLDEEDLLTVLFKYANNTFQRDLLGFDWRGRSWHHMQEILSFLELVHISVSHFSTTGVIGILREA